MIVNVHEQVGILLSDGQDGIDCRGPVLHEEMLAERSVPFLQVVPVVDGVDMILKLRLGARYLR
jgi:hypothetical protein